jgi:8-oxo-dGTP pyrophosphatase MutT (NUDIX family)
VKYLLEQTDETVFKDPKYGKPDSFTLRPTVKAIIKKDDKFGFVTNDASGLIMFAGGGADSDDLGSEIVRECREETGWKVKVIKEIGKTRAFNYKGGGREVVTSIFETEVVSEESEDLREEEEKKINMQIIFLDPMMAIHRMSLQDTAAKKGVYDIHYYSSFLIQRDYFIFKKCQKTTTLNRF